MILIDPSAFPDAGLYLLFPDGLRLDLTEDVIGRAAQRFLGDPMRLPDHVRAAAEYQPCSICPQRDTAKICHAIVATLPFVDDVDRYVSYDRVTAVYRERGSAIIEVSQTNMVEALKYLTMLSLMHYCEVGRKYFSYFLGVSPLMPAEQIALRVFHNLYFDCRGDLGKIRSIIAQMQEEIQVTTRCQMDRLRLICRNDAFLNALVNVHSTAGWLDYDLTELMNRPAVAAPETSIHSL